MKRIKLTHGTARVEDNVSDETIAALNKLSVLAYNHEPIECINYSQGSDRCKIQCDKCKQL